MDGLHLFNDDTCPSGHISRPAQVDVLSLAIYDHINLVALYCINVGVSSDSKCIDILDVHIR